MATIDINGSETYEALCQELEAHLFQKLVPFWGSMRDLENGGFYGYKGYDLALDKSYDKGCILHSRILWFFSSTLLLLDRLGPRCEYYTCTKGVRECADHAYRFIASRCVDREQGGVFWSVTYDGAPADTTKHTYNQAFAIYALSAYYAATGNDAALELAFELQRIIESKCRDELGYLEAFGRSFVPASNEKLSENGVMAHRTMNTLLHVFEAYTLLFQVTGDEATGEYLRQMLATFVDKVYNADRGRLEVFFDPSWKSILDLTSYGHDIEASWLIDRGLVALLEGGALEADSTLAQEVAALTASLARSVYAEAFTGECLLNENERGVVDKTRIWWVQAEAMVGFMNHWQKALEPQYLEATTAIWAYIKEHFMDTRLGSEWFENVNEDGSPQEKPIVQPWKCPYHNGRMCMELVLRGKQRN